MSEEADREPKAAEAATDDSDGQLFAILGVGITHICNGWWHAEVKLRARRTLLTPETESVHRVVCAMLLGDVSLHASYVF